MDSVITEVVDSKLVVSLNRPEVRNAVDRDTAALLYSVFADFAVDSSLDVAILTGRGPDFCAGADLQALASGTGNEVTVPSPLLNTPGPMGPTRLEVGKPVLCAVEGHAVAGGLELAIWADMRVAATDAVFGVYCRRWGVPLIDGGTVRLPQLVGLSRATDLILTGRGITGEEALAIGLVNRICPPGQALPTALELAAEIAKFPQECLRTDLTATRRPVADLESALSNEVAAGQSVLASARAGAAAFLASRGN